jgi:hypothetical protein
MSSTDVAIPLGISVPFITIGEANVILPGTTFVGFNFWVTSPNQQYVLILKDDGNLCFYQVIGASNLKPGGDFFGEELWCSGTQNNPFDICVLEPYGGLSIYACDGNKIWSSETDGINLAGLYVQNDGKFHIYQIASVWQQPPN